MVLRNKLNQDNMDDFSLRQRHPQCDAILSSRAAELPRQARRAVLDAPTVRTKVKMKKLITGTLVVCVTVVLVAVVTIRHVNHKEHVDGATITATPSTPPKTASASEQAENSSKSVSLPAPISASGDGSTSN